MSEHFDLVIAGGSFAGLACARTAALRGLKVAVLDPKLEPGARPRTTGIVVKEACDDFDLPAHLMRKVRGVRLYAPDDRALDLHAPGYVFQAADTPALLRWMADEAARAGATLLYGRGFDHANLHERRVELPSLGLSASFLIGADGARSRVAVACGLGRNERFLVGIEIECEPLQVIDPRFLHCFADSRLAPGYIGWVVPGVNATQIGVAASRQARPDLRLLLDRLQAIGSIGRLRVMAKRGGLIPCGGTLRRLGSACVLLIGDAAGLVSPVTGGRHSHRAAFRPARRTVRLGLSGRSRPASGRSLFAGGAAISREKAAEARTRLRPAQRADQCHPADGADAGFGAAALLPQPGQQCRRLRSLVAGATASRAKAIRQAGHRRLT